MNAHQRKKSRRERELLALGQGAKALAERHDLEERRLREELTQSLQHRQALQLEVDALTAGTKTLAAHLSARKQEVEELQEGMARLSAQLQRTVVAVTKAKALSDDLAQELAIERERRADAEKATSDLRKEFRGEAKLRRRLQDRSKDVERLQAELSQLRRAQRSTLC